jgi:hypothetical protein
MTSILTTAAVNAACNAVVDLVDVGTLNATGAIVYRTSEGDEVATLNLSNPAFGDAVAGVATANTITSDTDATGGVLSYYTVEDRDNTEIFRGTITEIGGGGQIEIVSTTIVAGTTVACSLLRHTQLDQPE